MLPAVAAISRPVHASTAGACFDGSEDNVGVEAVDVEPNATHITLWQAFGKPLPRLTTVHRPVDTATRTSTIKAACRATPLVSRSEQRVGVIRIHRQVNDTSVLVNK